MPSACLSFINSIGNLPYNPTYYYTNDNIALIKCGYESMCSTAMAQCRDWPAENPAHSVETSPSPLII